MTFPICPNCNNEWILLEQNHDHNYYNCPACDLGASSTNNEIDVVGKRLDPYIIAWYRNGTSSVAISKIKDPYYDNMVTFNHHIPFDITEDQLLLYLTFS